MKNTMTDTAPDNQWATGLNAEDGMFIKRFCTVAWVITGLCAAAIYINRRGDSNFDVDHVYGLMARDLLPGILPGLVGLFIASMLAAVMSSCDAFMVACSALFTENVYRKHIVLNASDRHYMIVGRVVSVVTVSESVKEYWSWLNDSRRREGTRAWPETDLTVVGIDRM